MGHKSSNMKKYQSENEEKAKNLRTVHDRVIAINNNPYTFEEISIFIQEKWSDGKVLISDYRRIDKETLKKLQDKGFHIDGLRIETYPPINKYTITWEPFKTII